MIDDISDSDDDLLGINNDPIPLKLIAKKYMGPTMEFINPNPIKIENNNKYQRLKEMKNVLGFVVNVHDATNFDIDLALKASEVNYYQDVISNQYTYQDFNAEFLENPNLIQCNDVKIGTTYRCRLRGIGINQCAYTANMWKSNQICIEIKKLLDRTDNWVICTLSDIDVYQRLLVDIIICTNNGPINLKTFLLDRMKNESNPIFYAYANKRDKLL